MLGRIDDRSYYLSSFLQSNAIANSSISKIYKNNLGKHDMQNSQFLDIKS